MRNTIVMLLVLLLGLLVYIASCGPKQVEEAAADNTPATEAPASPLVAASSSDTEKAATGAALTRAKSALKNAGFGALSVEQVDGSLLLRGEVASPADRVRAGRALANLNMPVINHVRAKKPAAAKPLDLTLERRNGKVIARGDVTAAIHQSLKQRFLLSPESAINETAISTPNAAGAFRLAANGLAALSEGAVQVKGTRIDINGESVSDSQALRISLNRQLPRGYSLTSNITTKEATVASVPVKTAAELWSPNPVESTQPARRAPVITKPAMVEVANSQKMPVVKTYKVPVAQPVEFSPPATSYDSEGYAIAETFPVVDDNASYYSDSVVSVSSGEAGVLPVAETSRYTGAVADTSVVVADSDCSPASLNLMPNGTIRFFHNSAQLTHKSRGRMEIATSILQRCPGVQVEVAGHTDVTGSDGMNGDISRARAERIHLYLVNHGIRPDRLRVASYGDSSPAHSNDTKFGRAMNRRVELVIR